MKPNILVVMCDQLGALPLREDGPLIAPNLRRLEKRGVSFERCYAPNAICSPSRASLMTGTYPSTHGVWDCTHTQRAPWVDLHGNPRLPHFAEKLAEAGYDTAYFGKWHVEQTQDPTRFGWREADTSLAGSKPAPLDAPRYTLKTPGYRDFPLAAPADDESVPSHPAFDRAISYLESRENEPAPFCCLVSVNEPHDPYFPPRRFFEQYDASSFPLPDSLEDDAADKPEIIRRMQRVWADTSPDDWRLINACYYATVTFIDHELGRLLDALERQGQADHTVVLFVSDHGDMLGAHGFLAKGIATSYEEVYRVPLILAGPGIEAGRRSRAVASLIDIAPTLLELAGGDSPDTIQGRSLSPLLRPGGEPPDDDDQWRRAYAEFYGQRFVYSQRILWQGSWKLVFSPGGVDELYDLSTDPGERRNRAADPECRPVLEDLFHALWRQIDAIDDDSFRNSHYPTLRTAPFGPMSGERETIDKA